MATRKVKLRGIGYWAKVFEQNRDLTGFEDALLDVGGQTCIDVDLDPDNMDKLRQSHSMKKGRPSPDNDTLSRVRFTRKWQETYGGGAPKVVCADGTDWDFDVEGSIGNGSVVDVVLSVYDTSRKSIVGTRLEKVIVVEHVPYVPVEDDDIPAPQQQQGSKSAADTDDDIPF